MAGGLSKLIKSINEENRIERIILLSKIEFKLRYYGNKLGLLWALINPLSQIFMYYIVFEYMLKQGVENYSVYLFSGLLLWIFFTDCTSRSILLLRSKRQLYEHTDMNKLELFIATHASVTIGFLFNVIIYFIWSLIFNIYPTITVLWFPLLYLNLLILSFGVSLILSNLFILFEDISQLWSIILRFGFFMSPILYRGEVFEKELSILNYLNPISGIIINSRNVLLYGTNIDLSLFAFNVFYSLGLLMIGFYMLQKIGPKASEII